MITEVTLEQDMYTKPANFSCAVNWFMLAIAQVSQALYSSEC